MVDFRRDHSRGPAETVWVPPEGIRSAASVFQSLCVRTHGAAEALAPDGWAVARARAGLLVLTVLAGTLAAVGPASAQEPVQRIMEQDPDRENLMDPPGYETAPPGTLGEVRKVGTGPRSMILIAGLGFGADVFEPLMERWTGRYTMYAVTLPGMGGTAGPPAPPPGTSFGEQTWTNGALSALEELLAEDDLRDVLVVGHWLTGTQLALRLAMRHPDGVAADALLAGSARWVQAAGDDPVPSPERRVRAIDEQMAPDWFRTVTRETWDDNNFLPGDYARHPVLGLRYWREAARPPLHVWVRYLCEFLAQDVLADVDGLTVPTYLLKPGMEGVYHPPGNNYMVAYTQRSWGDVVEELPFMEAETLPETRVVPWADEPDAVDRMVTAFFDRVLAR